VVVDDRQPGDSPVPAELQAALSEWAAVASTVGVDGAAAERDLVSRRGLQLAGRLSEVVGRPVKFVDPVTSEVHLVQRRSPGPASGLRAEPPGPTPWGTGLVVAAFFAVLTAVADTALSQAFADAFGLLWVPANVLVVLGLTPSLWLARRTAFWRWPALGAAVGLAVAWICLLAGMLA
jgi:hypothetical protein